MKTAKEYCSELLIYLLAVSRPTFESVAGGGGAKFRIVSERILGNIKK